MHAAVTPETTGLIGAEQFATMKEGAIFVNSARAHACTTPTRSSPRCNRDTSPARGSTTSTASTSPPTTRSSAMGNVVLTPHIGGATYDTEANHSKLIADGLAELLAGGWPDNLVNPEVSVVSPSEPLTAQETKEQLLWVAQEMLRTNLVQGTAGNCAARLPDGNAVLTPSSLDYLTMTLDDLVVCDLDGNVLEGERNPTTEKALHLTRPAAHDEIDADDALPREVRHDVRPHPTADPAPSSKSSTCSWAATWRSRNTARPVPTTSPTRWRSASAKKAAVLMANHGLFAVGKNPQGRAAHRHLVERTAEIIWGARALGEVVPLPDEVNKQFSGYYRYGRTGKF